MIKHNLIDLVDNGKNILLLQGPIGSFFYDLATYLHNKQKNVFKINLNAGDEYFFPENDSFHTTAYRDTIENFQNFLSQYISYHQIDSLVCFGDNRSYHIMAKILAEQFKLNFWVFEEGYFRPHYVTLEKMGVNAYSLIPKNAQFFLEKISNLTAPPEVESSAKGFSTLAKIAICYYVNTWYYRKKYPDYQHHRSLSIRFYARSWLWSGIKRAWYYIKDFRFKHFVENGKFGDFYIVPLQVYNDSQVKVHSDYFGVKEFLLDVLDSFLLFAPKHLTLIIKHHPMDRGFTDYTHIINTYIHRYPQLKRRLFYVHDVPMPVFLRHGKGMITLNSTCGVSALLHNMPVLTLGRANYDFAGLTYQGDLKSFWHNLQPPNPKVFEAFRLYHLNKTQINGSFYNQVYLSEFG
ncbi:capsule biosynthesis protein [Lonepinella sp. MS14436]|uniref:capsule biosynthesis protein n=1 Tax=Lonepinella sp. MS14436 TaxID=3003619 RepID=UPI0036D7B7AD